MKDFMSIEIINFAELNDDLQKIAVDETSAYTHGNTNEKPQMLAVSAGQVAAKYVGFVAVAKGDFYGYIGAAAPQQWKENIMSEVGTLWVPAAHRNQGIAHQLIRAVASTLVEQNVVPYAFCNPLSASIFKSEGYDEISPCSVPASAFDLCAQCPKKTAEGCCDRMMEYQGDLV